MTDKHKLTTSLVLLFLGLGIYMSPTQWLAANPQTSETIRLGGALGGLLLAGAVFWFTEARHQFLQLIREARVEVLKVVWPTRPETTTYALTVVAFTLAVAFYCWIVDKGIEFVLYDWILRIK